MHVFNILNSVLPAGHTGPGYKYCRTCRIVHYWYHNICVLMVNYFIAVFFKEILVSALWRWRDNYAKTCRNYVKDRTYKLQDITLVGVTW